MLASKNRTLQRLFLAIGIVRVDLHISTIAAYQNLSKSYAF